MGVWMPIALVAVTQIALAVTQVALRLITVAGVVWQERARAESHRVQMETAGSSGTILCERLGDGSALLIIPATAAPEQTERVDQAARVISGEPGEKARL